MRDLPFVLGCAFAIVCLLLPAAWHVRSKNSGTLLYLAWSLTGNLVYFVNAIVWAGNIENPAPIWCDIASKLVIGLAVGLPCASLCIQRRLYAISCVRSVSASPAEKMRTLIIDLLIGLGIPIMVMTLHYIVQGHRYDIIEDVGCWPTVYLSAPAIPLVFMWPLIISLVSIPYCVLSYRSFYRRRAAFQTYLATNEPGLNVDRYLRLMALASMEIFIVLPLNLLSIIVNLTSNPLLPYTSWDDVHYDFGRVAYVTNFSLDLDYKFYVEFTVARWAVPLTGFLFFVFFGLSTEARKDYHRVFGFLSRHLGFRSPFFTRRSGIRRSLLDRLLHRRSTSTSSFGNDNSLTALPTHTPRRRRDTLNSLGSKDDAESTHTILGREQPIKLPEAVYSPLYRSSHATRPSLSPSDVSDLDISTNARASSTAYLLRDSPLSPTSASWDAKPLPPIPSSRPTSMATMMSTDANGQAMDFTTDPVELPAPAALSSTGLGADLHGEDGNESIYYTPAPLRLSLISTEYQPSIPDIPGAWHSGSKKTGARGRPNPFF